METAVASLACAAAIACCAERLVRGRDSRWALVPLAGAAAAWGWLWSLRVPPTPGSALLAFAIADLAVLVLGVVAVMRLLGAFDELADDRGDDDEGGGSGEEPPVVPPWDPAPGQPRPLARHHVPPRNRRRQDHRRRRPTKV